MVKYYIFDKDIEEEPVSRLINFITETEGELEILFQSSGGELEVGSFLSRVLNANKDRITLVAGYRLLSTAFDIFFRFKGKKELSKDGTVGLIHKTSMTVRTNSAWEVEISKTLKPSDERLLKELTFLTKDELKRFRKGEDVVFSPKRMEEIFGNNN